MEMVQRRCQLRGIRDNLPVISALGVDARARSVRFRHHTGTCSAPLRHLSGSRRTSDRRVREPHQDASQRRSEHKTVHQGKRTRNASGVIAHAPNGGLHIGSVRAHIPECRGDIAPSAGHVRHSGQFMLNAVEVRIHGLYMAGHIVDPVADVADRTARAASRSWAGGTGVPVRRGSTKACTSWEYGGYQQIGYPDRGPGHTGWG